ncbi:diguanylate cyclase and metal dependent phosphohydrolase [Alkaliphilus metalliredigens QYMF]|uniref:Diguanylate cyclase and metal dependent phosphohydrolase n=1 Tax=Alkaliphilus metalliredigens (strain QYMF) TaxID=293826 RepID=A6TLW6_ALKMQ|nr:HD domain-containing phosphohydrolase [Alkaliphilus metalliredigens]ABR47184.1 diguanylate cyclase and metal dependent phosphohydrolase [Alkaliphilus metalliredigens QYMF]
MEKSSYKEVNLKNISIRKIIIISFVILLTTTVGIISYITFSSWRESANDTIIRMADDLNREIVSQIETFMKGPKQMIEVNRRLIEKGIVDIDNEANREMFFVNAINSHDGEGVYSFSYGTESGEYYGARKNKKNVVEIMRNNEETGGHSWYYSVTENTTAGELVLEAGKFDSRTRAWYKAAKETKGLVFSPIYKHFVMDDLTVSLAAPIYSEEGELQGVLGSHITLSRINYYLKEIVKANNAFAVIVEKNSGELIANSLNLANFKTSTDGDFERLPVNEIDNKAIVQAYNNYMNGDVDHIKIDYEKDRLHIKYIEYQDEGLDWLVITAVPESILVADIMDTIETAFILTILALFISVLIFLKLTKKFIDPINSLIDTQKKFASGDLSTRATIERNDEIGMVAKSFNRMANTIYDFINTLEEKVKERTWELDVSNRALAENKDQLQLILDSTAEGIYGIDLNGDCTFINDSGVNILGYKDQTELIGKNLHLQIHHSRKNGTPMTVDECSVIKALLEGKGTHVDDEVFWKKDGTWFSVEYYSYPQYLEGEIVGAVVTFMDNTERKKMEQMIFNEKEQFKTTLLSVGDGVISTDKQGKVTVMNSVAEKLTGWTQVEAYGKPLEEVLNIINELTREVCENPAKKVLETGNIIEMATHTMLISKNGDEIPIEDRAAPIKDRDGNITGVVIVFMDYTDKKEKLMQIEYLSMHDHLTGLYNRRYMEDAISRLDTERNLPLTIMVLDVNGLKLVNDAFGHEMGDQLLKIITRVMKDVCRADDIIGRTGGDEFLIVLPQIDGIQAHKIKKRIKEAASTEKLDSLIVSVAIGYSVKINSHESVESIMISADNQMYKDKLKYGKLMRSQTIKSVIDNINLKYDQEQIHIERVSKYCQAIATAMSFSEKMIGHLKTAGELHDIGKIIVPPELLNKAEKLTAKEFEVIKRHPEVSYQILKSVEEYTALAEDVLYHHERWDGTGYPQGLKGQDIPLNARIITVADAYEAMTAKRAYQQTKSKDEAIVELEKYAGTQFDPDIVKVFVEKVLGKEGEGEKWNK